ncbi:MAG: diguanylate cyclase domain-containing protein [Candidatus Cryosericum sp.]
MLTTKPLYLELYAILACIVLIVLVHMLRDREARSVLHRIFIAIISCVGFNIVAEATTWLANGVPGRAMHRVVEIANGADIVLIILPSLLWLCYVVYYVTRDIQHLRRLAVPMAAAVGYVVFLAASAPTNGLLFTVDALNFYHRGPWFLQPPIIAYAALAEATVFLILNARRVPRSQLVPLLAFPILPLIGGLSQNLVYGLSSAQAGTVLGLLLVYISLQSQLRGTDYLTGLANRWQLDAAVQRALANPDPRRPAALLMIDVDNLKSINDTWGHVMGDKAIEQCAAILRRCFHYDDTIARYAGDEFMVLLRLDRPENIQAVMARLEDIAKRMATPDGAPFAMTISAGYALFPSAGITTAADFYEAADRSMYEAKRRAHATDVHS